MCTPKQKRFEEFRYELPIICNCGYPMKCVTKPIKEFDIPKDIITTMELELIKRPYYPKLDLTTTGTTGATLSIPIDPLIYECTSCLIRIKIGNYD